ncbi:MAG TPA: DUF748 domain-containing protein, partial [Ramlibacter sp.]|nr:DUF748 domain-containing protein [Ramlibacter sp.]
MNLDSTRLKRRIAIVAGVLAAYAVLGFGIVPLAIKSQLPQWGQSALEHQASVGQVTFNPFTLRLEAADLRLAQADGAPLFAVGKLAVELQWRSLVRWAWSFAEIRITGPHVSLAIAPDGRFNLAELLARFKPAPDQTDGTGGLPRIVIAQFALEQGQVDMKDQRAGYSNVFSPIDFALTDFSTLPDQNDAHTFSAQSASGGKLRWKGQTSLNPIRGSGELTLEDASLPEAAVYLKSYTRARVAAGRLSASLPYRFSYADGKLAASLDGARLALSNLALAREGATDSFAALTRLDVTDVHADLVHRQATIGEVRADGGKLAVRRDAKGELDLAQLMVAAAGPAAAPPPGAAVVVQDWKLAIKQVLFDQVAVSAIDETVSPALRLGIGRVRLQLKLDAEQASSGLQLKLADAALGLADLTLGSGAQTPLKLGQLGFTEGTLDLAARRASVGRLYADVGQLQLVRDRAGRLNVMELLPSIAQSGPQAAAAPSGAPWTVAAKSVALSKFGADLHDEGTGVKVHVNDLAVSLEGASSNPKQAVQFNAGLSLREGGRLSARGSAVPGTGAVAADVRIQQLALAPLQPLLAQHVKLKIAGGQVSAQGNLTLGGGAPKTAGARYVGSLDIAGLALQEADGDLFASWKNVGAQRLTASLDPPLLDIPELRVIDANAKLIIEDDRSLNAARLLVKPAAAPTAPVVSAAAEPFPVRVRRIRLQNAKLDFTDLSLRPQFAARIHDLNGVVNGLSSQRDSRSQIELDGRVDEFGLARIRGELNPFAPSHNTDIGVVFRNVDMVTTSPYTMKFAGYRIAEGKISLDLQYKVRAGQLEGANQIVIDKLTLGERVDSPDALKLPLALAIAILKDSDGRIDLGLPV